MATTFDAITSRGSIIERVGKLLVRYGLVIVLLWIGAVKFTAVEAETMKPYIATSPFMSWMNNVLSVQAGSNVLGVTEIITGTLIALRPWFPKASALGSLLGIGMFSLTLSFLFSLPGWEESLGGFPALSHSGGCFLLKDLVLLGASVLTLGDSISAGWPDKRRSSEVK